MENKFGSFQKKQFNKVLVHSQVLSEVAFSIPISPALSICIVLVTTLIPITFKT